MDFTRRSTLWTELLGYATRYFQGLLRVFIRSDSFLKITSRRRGEGVGIDNETIAVRPYERIDDSSGKMMLAKRNIIDQCSLMGFALDVAICNPARRHSPGRLMGSHRGFSFCDLLTYLLTIIQQAARFRIRRGTRRRRACQLR